MKSIEEKYRKLSDIEHVLLRPGMYVGSVKPREEELHLLSEEATVAYERAREVVARFLGLPSARGCVFVRGATEGINLVAECWGRTHLRAGDEILLTQLEHHANIVPWQVVAERTGAKVVVAPVTPRGEVDLAAFRALLSPRSGRPPQKCWMNDGWSTAFASALLQARKTGFSSAARSRARNAAGCGADSSCQGSGASATPGGGSSAANSPLA